MKKSLLVALLTIFIGVNCHSQSLSIDSVITETNIADTVNYGTTGNYNVVVQYTGASLFSGTIYIVSGVDSTGGIQSIDTIGTRVVSNMANLDTTNILITDSFANVNGYRLGGNVVVIWPVATTLTTLDTFQTTIFVDFGVGVNESRDLYNSISFYPNPTKNYLNIGKKDQKITLKQVRIYNLKGQLIYDEKFRTKINISNFPKGLYFLKLYTKNDKEIHYKLIKD